MVVLWFIFVVPEVFETVDVLGLQLFQLAVESGGGLGLADQMLGDAGSHFVGIGELGLGQFDHGFYGRLGIEQFVFHAFLVVLHYY